MIRVVNRCGEWIGGLGDTTRDNDSQKLTIDDSLNYGTCTKKVESKRTGEKHW